MSTTTIKRIGIDCYPGSPRPDTHIGPVVSGTPIEELPEVQPGAEVSKLFGAWMWEFPCDDATWDEIRDTIQCRISQLYEKGQIRGAVVTKASKDR